MSIERQQSQGFVTEEFFEKAERYETIIDHHILNDAVPTDNEEILEEFDTSYDELAFLDKAAFLADIYNKKRGRDTVDIYDPLEIMEYLDAIMEEPESIESSLEDTGREMLEEERIPEMDGKKLDSVRTGRYPNEPEQERAEYILETEKPEEWIRMELVQDRD